MDDTQADTQAHEDGPTSEYKIRHRAWRVAQRTDAHQVVIQRGTAVFHTPLKQEKIMQGDVLLYLISPYSNEPGQPAGAHA